MAFSWFFPQETIESKTPSRADGISLPVETRYRKDGARFVINAANTLKFRYDTLATGVVFYHRFFMIQSYKEFDRWVVAGACLLLAGKVEETPKKCRDILKVTRSLLNDQQWAGFGNNPKEELLTHERILLQTIKFDLQVEHPYGFLLKFAKELKGDKAKIEKLVQMAWTFVNDSLVTTLCIQWEPRAVAVAFIYLAGKLSKYDLQGLSSSKSRAWWRQFVDTLDIHDLDSICHQVLDTYGESGKDTSDDQQSDEETISQQISQSMSHPLATPTSMPSPLSSVQTPGRNGQIPKSLVTPAQSDPSQLMKQAIPNQTALLTSYQLQTVSTSYPGMGVHTPSTVTGMGVMHAPSAVAGVGLHTPSSVAGVGLHTPSSVTGVGIHMPSTVTGVGLHMPSTATHLPTHVQTQSIQGVSLNNTHQPQLQLVSSYQPQPTVGITTFALANPLQALQNIRTASAAQQSTTLQPGTPYSTVIGGVGNVAGTSLQMQTQQAYSSHVTLQTQNPRQPLVNPLVAGTQAVGGGYQQQQINPQQQLLQQYPLMQQGVKVQPYQLSQTAVKSQQYSLTQQQTTLQTPQQPIVRAGVQQGTNYIQSGLIAYPHLRAGGGVAAGGVAPGTQKPHNSVMNSTLSRQAFSSPYHQSSLQSLNLRTNQMAANTKTQITNLVPQQLQQNASYLNYVPQTLTPGQTGLPYLPPGQGGLQTTSAQQLASIPQQQRLPTQLGNQSHMIQQQQSTQGHMIQQQQSTQGHMIQQQQSTQGHVIQQQQTSVGVRTNTQPYPQVPQPGTRGNLGLTPSHNKQGGSSGGWGGMR